MLNYKKAQTKPRGEQVFSFSRKQGAEQISILPSEKRSINGWLSAIIDPHQQDFIRAFNNSKRRNIYDVFVYIERNYTHLTPIAIYYITAALNDYGWTNEQKEDDLESKTKRDIFLDVLIEQLSEKFYRESQWLTKIIHIPIYYLFSILDTHKKGYLTLSDLLKYCKISKKLEPGSEQYLLVIKKLKANLGQQENKMYLQNLAELQIRADMVTFTQQLSSKAPGSQIYRHIKQRLQKRQFQLLKQQEQKAVLEDKQNRQMIQALQLKQEDINIKDITRLLLSNNLPEYKKQMQSKKNMNIQPTEAKLSQNSINLAATPKTNTQIRGSRRNFEKQSNEYSLFDKLNSNHKQPTQIQAQRQMILLSKKNNLLVRQAILSELQAIRYMKIRNNSEKMDYL